MKHKHAELIHAWADGAKIEVYCEISGNWSSAEDPSFYTNKEYRIKPQPVIEHRYIGVNPVNNLASSTWSSINDVDQWNNILKLTLTDCKLTNVEIVK